MRVEISKLVYGIFETVPDAAMKRTLPIRLGYINSLPIFSGLAALGAATLWIISICSPIIADDSFAEPTASLIGGRVFFRAPIHPLKEDLQLIEATGLGASVTFIRSPATIQLPSGQLVNVNEIHSKCGIPKSLVSYAGLSIDCYQCKIHPEWWRRIDVMLPLWMPLALFAALPCIRLAAHIVNALRRIAPGSCKKCRYNLTGNVSGICPECGTTVRENPYPRQECRSMPSSN